MGTAIQGVSNAAMVAYVASQLANYLPLTGGTISGLLTLNKYLLYTGSASGSKTENVAFNHVTTPTLANGVSGQLDINRDVIYYLVCTESGTAFSLAIGTTSTPANTIVSSQPVSEGQMFSVRVPAGWYAEWSATTATFSQLAVGC